jgi:hypothetical protein
MNRGIVEQHPGTGMVRSRALQRGRGAVPPCPEVRAEALDYEPHVESKKPPVDTENLWRKPKKPQILPGWQGLE